MRGYKELLRELIILFVSIAILYLLVTSGLKYVLATETPVMVVVSGSMRPTININDLIIVQGVDPRTLDVGDIIVFKHPNLEGTSCEDGRCIVHRIVEVISRDPPRFRTKGDANPTPDPFIVEGEDIVGKVVLIIPQVGLLPRIIRPPYNYFLMVIIILVFILYEAQHYLKEDKESIEGED